HMGQITRGFSRYGKALSEFVMEFECVLPFRGSGKGPANPQHALRPHWLSSRSKLGRLRSLRDGANVGGFVNAFLAGRPAADYRRTDEVSHSFDRIFAGRQIAREWRPKWAGNLVGYDVRQRTLERARGFVSGHVSCVF